MNEQAAAFIEYVKSECKSYNVKIVLSPDDHVTTEAGCKCNGFFDIETLAVATGKEFEKWFKTFVHEYCHMTQWIEDTKEWNACKDPCDAEEITELWYDHKIELTKEQALDWTVKARDVELDCEKRVIQLIDRFNLPIDKEAYIKHANAYIYFWTYTLTSRSWYKIGKEPYNIKEIVDAMPSNFYNNYNVMPETYMKLYKEHC